MPGDVLDSPYSWVVAAAGFLMYFIMYGLGRVSGLLFVASLDFYGTNRETASFPFSLACALRYMGGPLAAYLAARFGIRFVILLGCVLSVVGVGACFTAENVFIVVAFWGGLYGLGSCFSTTLLSQLNNIYFDKHLTTSTGLSYAGESLSGFILPPLVEVLLNEYGINGTYLLLSGLTLNAIPVAMLLKEPPNESSMKESKYMNREIPTEIVESYRRKLSDRNFSIDHTIFLQQSKYCTNANQESMGDTLSRKYCVQGIHPNEVSFNTNIQSIFRNKIKKAIPLSNVIDNEIKKKYENNLVCAKNETSKTNTSRKVSTTSQVSSSTLNSGTNPHLTGSFKKEMEIFSIECSENNEMPTLTIEQEKGFLRDFHVFLDIQFLLISFTTGMVGLFCFVLPAILNDFSLDKGISITDSTYLLMAMSVSDMVARLGFGWVTDKGCMSSSNFCALCFFVLAVCLALLVWSSEFSLLLGILSLMGLSLGALTPLYITLIKEYIEPTRHLMANASSDLLGVPFLLSISSLIGYFRDNLGSYDWFVYLLCLLSLSCCFMVLALPYIKKRKTKAKLILFN